MFYVPSQLWLVFEILLTGGMSYRHDLVNEQLVMQWHNMLFYWLPNTFGDVILQHLFVRVDFYALYTLIHWSFLP